MAPTELDELLQHPSVWRAAGARAAPGTLASGFPRLDAQLPGGGWPLDTLIELLLPAQGVGELHLLVPVLRQLGGSAVGAARRWIAWLGPPHLPYAPALAGVGLDPSRMLIVQPKGAERAQPLQQTSSALQRRSADPALWAMEQALRSRACAAALGWADTADINSLRRLKLAAAEGRSFAVLFRPHHRAGEPSPAALRLLLEPQGGSLDVHILKCRGGRPGKVEAVLEQRLAGM